MIMISLIMPLYNHEKYVGKAIKSLLEQSYTNFELIVIDDGSTDSSPEIVKSFNDVRIKYYRQENKGVERLCETINYGLSKCIGELVTMVPSDDMWPKDRFSSQVEYFDNDNVVLVFGRMRLIDAQDRFIGKTKPIKNLRLVNNVKPGEIFNQLLTDNFIPEPTVLIRTSVLRKIGGYLQPTGMYAEDFPTQLELARHGEFRYVDKVLAHYRMHLGQMSKKHIVKMVSADCDYALKFYSNLTQIEKENSGLTYDKLKQLISKRLAYFHFAAGRLDLIEHRFDVAKNNFSYAISSADLLTKFKALLGLLHCYFKTDMEWMAKLSAYKANLK